jgi:hypothetical protein
MIENEDLNRIQKETYEYAENLAKSYYIDNLQGTKIYCKSLRMHVMFTHSGWNHFVEKDRPINELITRFFALPRVVGVLRTTRKFGDYNARKKKSLKVEYWGLVAEVEKVIVKVVITRINMGKPYFLSCIWMGEVKD